MSLRTPCLTTTLNTSQQSIVAMELFPFLMKLLLRNLFRGQFVPFIMRPYCASFYTKYACPIMRTEDFLFFLFCQEEKLSSLRKRIWWPTIYISRVQSSEKLEKIIFHTIRNLGGKKETFTSNENLQGHLKHMHTWIAFLTNVKKKLIGTDFFGQ